MPSKRQRSKHAVACPPFGLRRAAAFRGPRHARHADLPFLLSQLGKGEKSGRMKKKGGRRTNMGKRNRGCQTPPIRLLSYARGENRWALAAVSGPLSEVNRNDQEFSVSLQTKY